MFGELHVMALSNLSQLAGLCGQHYFLLHFTNEKTVSERGGKWWYSDSSQGQSGPRASAPQCLASSLCGHVGGMVLFRVGTAQAKAERPAKMCILKSGVPGPLSKEDSVRGQTEQGCLSPVDVCEVCINFTVAGSLMTESHTGCRFAD